MRTDYENRDYWSPEDWAAWKYTSPYRKARGYTNVCKADTENVASDGTVEKVPKSDVKVREMFLNREGSPRIWHVTDCRSPSNRVGMGTEYRLERAIDAIHCLAELRQLGAVVPDTVMTELAVQALYDEGFEGPVR